MDGPLILICSTKLRSLTYVHARGEKNSWNRKLFCKLQNSLDVALRQDKKYSCNKIATAQIQISCQN